MVLSTPSRRQRRRSRPEVASPPRSRPRVSVSSTATAHVPWAGTPRTATSPPALTRHGPGKGEQLRDTFGREAFADPAEVEAVAGLELDPAAVDGDARRRTAADVTGVRRVRFDLVERAVVAGGDERVVDGRIETTTGPLARGERELRRLRRAPARRRSRRRGSGARARSRRGSATSICSSRSNSASAATSALVGRRRRRPAARSWCPSRGTTPVHHEVLVTTSGGRLTTRTEGVAAHSGRECVRLASSLR